MTLMGSSRDMKFRSITLLMLCANLHSYAEPPSTMHGVLVSDLSWFFHWFTKQPVPSDTLLCRGQRLGDTGRIYCSPVGIEIQLSWDDSNIVRTNVITETLRSYEQEMAELKRLNDGVVRSTYHEEIARSEIAEYKVDLNVSTQWMARTRIYMENTAKLYKRHGKDVALRYPKVGKSDPFYHVYLTIGSLVDSIWQFELANGQLEDFAHWTFDRRHNGIPNVAQQFVSDPRRWLRITQLDGGLQREMR